MYLASPKKAEFFKKPFLTYVILKVEFKLVVSPIYVKHLFHINRQNMHICRHTNMIIIVENTHGPKEADNL